MIVELREGTESHVEVAATDQTVPEGADVGPTETAGLIARAMVAST